PRVRPHGRTAYTRSCAEWIATDSSGGAFAGLGGAVPDPHCAIGRRGREERVAAAELERGDAGNVAVEPCHFVPGADVVETDDSLGTGCRDPSPVPAPGDREHPRLAAEDGRRAHAANIPDTQSAAPRGRGQAVSTGIERDVLNRPATLENAGRPAGCRIPEA